MSIKNFFKKIFYSEESIHQKKDRILHMGSEYIEDVITNDRKMLFLPAHPGPYTDDIKLIEFPKKLLNCKKLEIIVLAFHNIKTLSEEILDMPELKYLDLIENPIDENGLEIIKRLDGKGVKVVLKQSELSTKSFDRIMKNIVKGVNEDL